VNKKNVAALGFFFSMTTALAASTSTDSMSFSKAEAEKYITAQESAWAESASTNDSSVVKRILADDFVGLLDGEVYNKAQAIEEAEKGPGDTLSNHLDYAHVRFFGNAAVVQGSETWTRKGKKSGHYVWLDTWIYQNGQWQVIAADDVTVPIKR
jgi:hypothetical protein